MRKRGKVFVLTGSIVAMLIAGTGCSKKNTGIKNEKLASDYMELFNMSEGIKTEEGWLEIYHGADFNHRYCLGALLLDLNDPSKVIARSEEPIMEPIAAYEQTGFFGNVVFTNGHLVDGDTITMYYGASDEVICKAELSISEILNVLKQTQKK